MVSDLHARPYGSTLEIRKLLDYTPGNWSWEQIWVLLTILQVREQDNHRFKHAQGLRQVQKKKVHTYEAMTLVLELSKPFFQVLITKVHTSLDETPPGLRIGLIEESLTPLHKTDGEIAMPIKGR
jgi:hypothetical protein